MLSVLRTDRSGGPLDTAWWVTLSGRVAASNTKSHQGTRDARGRAQGRSAAAAPGDGETVALRFGHRPKRREFDFGLLRTGRADWNQRTVDRASGLATLSVGGIGGRFYSTSNDRPARRLTWSLPLNLGQDGTDGYPRTSDGRRRRHPRVGSRFGSGFAATRPVAAGPSYRLPARFTFSVTTVVNPEGGRRNPGRTAIGWRAGDLGARAIRHRREATHSPNHLPVGRPVRESFSCVMRRFSGSCSTLC